MVRDNEIEVNIDIDMDFEIDYKRKQKKLHCEYFILNKDLDSLRVWGC